MAVMDGTEKDESLFRLSDWSLASAQDLAEMDPFDLIGELPVLSELKDKVDEQTLNRFKMIHMWCEYFIDSKPLRTDLPKLDDLSDGPMSKEIRESVLRIKKLPQNLYGTELRYLFGLWVRELIEARYCEPGQISFMYTSYYLEIRDQLFSSKDNSEPEGVGSLDGISSILDLSIKQFGVFGNEIDISKGLAFIEDRLNSIGFPVKSDQEGFGKILDGFYESVGKLADAGLKEPFDPSELCISGRVLDDYLKSCQNLGNLTGPFASQEFYSLRDIDRIELLMFCSQYLFSYWEKFSLRRSKRSPKLRELFGYLQSHQLIPNTKYGDIIDRFIRIQTDLQ